MQAQLSSYGVQPQNRWVLRDLSSQFHSFYVVEPQREHVSGGCSPVPKHAREERSIFICKC